MLDFQKLLILTAGTVQSVNMPNLVPIRQPVAEIDFSRWRPSAILDLL